MQGIELKDHYILGPIIGDVLGSPYEWDPVKRRDFDLFDPHCTFTDDTVMTVATMKVLVDMHKEGRTMPTVTEITDTYRSLGRKYHYAGYGPRFRIWLRASEYKGYGSYGNGSGMRVAPVGWWCENEDELIEMAEKFSIVSHDHVEGIKGAIAIALGVYHAKNKQRKSVIAEKIVENTNYDLGRTMTDIKKSGYKFDVTCQGSVPESIISFLESRSFEDCAVNAIWLGGDADTMCCMACSIAEAYYGIENIIPSVRDFVWRVLPLEFKSIIAEFSDLIKNRKQN